MSGERRIEAAVEVPGDPETVWRAIATGPGITSWFVPTELAEHSGGEVVADFGELGRDEGRVVAWEPPRRLVTESRSGERTLAFEWLVEARSGHACVVRLVSSGFGAGAEWDDLYDGMREGWQLFLENLRLHLTHFAGRRARAIIPMAITPGPNAAAWGATCRALGVSPTLTAGARLATSGPAVPPLAGVVTLARPSAYVVLLDRPLAGTALVAAEGDDPASVSVWQYLYGGGDVLDGITERWRTWMAAAFPGAA